MNVRHPYTTPRERVQLDNFDTSRTKQQFKKECDINQIMAKFQKTRAITHLAKYEQTFGDATGVDLLEAMNTVVEAQQMFDDLPSSIRKQFDGPASFLDYVQDENNRDRLYELGLAVRPEEPEPLLVRVQPDNVQPDEEEPEPRSEGD